MSNPFDSRTFIASESVNNQETKVLANAKNAKQVFLVDANGNGTGFTIPSWDYATMTISPATTETYVLKSGGSGGTTVATIVIVYTDSTRVDISTVTKT